MTQQDKMFIPSLDGATPAGTTDNPLRLIVSLEGNVGDLTLSKEVDHTISVGASTTTDTAGGDLAVTAGAGSDTNADGGALALDAGAKAGSGTDGAVAIGATNAESVSIGRTGKTTTVNGALAVTGAATLNGAVTLGDAAADLITLTGVVSGDVTLKKEQAHAIAPAASTTTDTAGAAVSLKGGAAAATNANGGACTIDGGAKAGSGVGGACTIGGTDAESVAICRSGKTCTINGSLAMGGAADASALVTLISTTKGLLVPVMTTTQRDAIASPAEGLVIYNSTTHKLNIRVAAAWEAVTSA